MIAVGYSCGKVPKKTVFPVYRARDSLWNKKAGSRLCVLWHRNCVSNLPNQIGWIVDSTSLRSQLTASRKIYWRLLYS